MYSGCISAALRASVCARRRIKLSLPPIGVGESLPFPLTLGKPISDRQQDQGVGGKTEVATVNSNALIAGPVDLAAVLPGYDAVFLGIYSTGRHR